VWTVIASIDIAPAIITMIVEAINSSVSVRPRRRVPRVIRTSRGLVVPGSNANMVVLSLMLDG
jgi:hypothetical protein